MSVRPLPRPPAALRAPPHLLASEPTMALSSTVRTFTIALSDVDRGTYDTLGVEGGAASKRERSTGDPCAGLRTRVRRRHRIFERTRRHRPAPRLAARPHRPPRSLDRRGHPSAPRLHKASKAADRVAVYCHKRSVPWLRTLAGSTVHNAGEIALFALEPATITQRSPVPSTAGWRGSSPAPRARLPRHRPGLVSFDLERLTWPTPGDTTPTCPAASGPHGILPGGPRCPTRP